MWQNNYLPKICTTRNLVTRFVSVCPPGFVCYSDSSPVAFTSLARSWTISDIGGLNSGCRCNTKDSDQTYDPFSKILAKNEEFRCVLLKNCRLVWKKIVKVTTWIQRLIMSANRDNAFSEHCPRIDGSTILDRDSMSWSWELAHLTRCCSWRGRELRIFT